ncbi:MAG: DNA polymerase III subunit delta' [Steroidobacteraceae bacterium]
MSETDQGLELPAAALAGLAASTPWLASARQRVALALRGGRLPHGLLLYGSPGVGQTPLAWWIAQLLFCRQQGLEPCGQCDDCVLFSAGTHPDLHWVGREDKATVIKVEQVRELSVSLTSKSFRGGYRVGIIDPVDTMNTNSYNAFLKTLEEPGERLALILVAQRTERIPATIQSRCQRVYVPRPPMDEALRWLRATESTDTNWSAYLEDCGGAPFAAIEAASAGEPVGPEMEAQLFDSRTTPDPMTLAQAWSKDRPAARLQWLELRLQRAIREQGEMSDQVNNNPSGRLKNSAAGRNIRVTFGLLDEVRRARQLEAGPANPLLLWENLLVGFLPATGQGTRRGDR